MLSWVKFINLSPGLKYLIFDARKKHADASLQVGEV